ncbi:MAG TPA: DUF481 domain-containing protein [Aeromonadales bacterium]|nr:DUF481 domain-containing protein [Aeromonadales bacterium]
MHLLRGISVVGVLSVLSCSVFAADKEQDKGPKGLSGSAEFGLVVTTGNTDNSTTNGKFKLSEDTKNWFHDFSLDVVNAKTDGVKTAERYFFNAKSNYKLDKNQFLFVGLSHDIDKFSGFDYQTSVTAGYGRKLYDDKTFKLSAEIGPGYRISEFDTGGSEKEGIIHLGAKSKYIINEFSSVGADLSVDSGSNQTISILDLGYVNKLTSALALKVGYNVKNSSNAPVGNKSTDTITAVSLLYSF